MKISVAEIIVLLLGVSAVAQQTQFTHQPESVVCPQFQGKKAAFECLYPHASTFYSWSLNGTFLSDLPSGVDLIVATSPSEDSPLARLTIPAIPQYNNTVVQCRAVVVEGGSFVPFLSDSAILYVQGPLQPVSALHLALSRTTITISWDPPFSLNLTTAEPDIQYCVDVYNVTGGGADLLESVCDITDTSYTFSASDPDQLFNFTVTPRSNVEGSLNGTTSEPVQGYVLREPIGVIPAQNIEVYIRSDPGHRIRIFFSSDMFGPSPGRQSTIYTAQFVCDQLGSRNCSISQTDIRDIFGVMTLEVDCPIESHHIFDLTLFAENLAGISASKPSLEISTHDVQFLSAVYITTMGQIEISCSFLPGSSDRGYLAIGFFGESTTYRVVYRNQDEPATNVSISGVQMDDPENMVLAVHDLRSDGGLPESRAAVRNPTITEDNTVVNHGPPTVHGQTLLPASEIYIENRQICIQCSFPTSQLAGCVGVIHSAGMENLTLLTVKNQSSPRNCTRQMQPGGYSVAVFGQMENDHLEEAPAVVKHISIVNSTPSSASVSVAVAIVVVMVIVSFVIVGMVLLVVRHRKMKSRVLAQPQVKNACYHVQSNQITDSLTETPPESIESSINQQEPAPAGLPRKSLNCCTPNLHANGTINCEPKQSSLQQNYDEPDHHEDYQGNCHFPSSTPEEGGAVGSVVPSAVPPPETSDEKNEEHKRKSNVLAEVMGEHQILDTLKVNHDQKEAAGVKPVRKECTLRSMCQSSDHAPIPYNALMIHYFGNFENLDVPLTRKISAMGYLNSGLHVTRAQELYQKRMSDDAEPDEPCEVVSSATSDETEHTMASSTAVSLETASSADAMELLSEPAGHNKEDEEESSGCMVANYVEAAWVSVAPSAAEPSGIAVTGDSVVAWEENNTDGKVDVREEAIANSDSGKGTEQPVNGISASCEEIEFIPRQEERSQNTPQGEDVMQYSTFMVVFYLMSLFFLKLTTCTFLRKHKGHKLPLTEETDNSRQGSARCFFCLPPPNEFSVQFVHLLKIILLGELGCILQPEDEGTCRLESAVASGGVWWDNNIPLPVSCELYEEYIQDETSVKLLSIQRHPSVAP